MDIRSFFKFGSLLSSTTFQAHPTGLRDANEERASKVVSLIKGEFESIQLPVTFEHEMGKKLRDVLDTGWPSLFLISERVRSVLEVSKLSGWTYYPIRLADQAGVDVNGYYGFSVTGRCGPIDISKSDVINKLLVPEGPFSKYYRGLCVGLDRWDGSDFFLPNDSTDIIVTSNAADELRRSKLTNVRLTNLHDIEFDEMTAGANQIQKSNGGEWGQGCVIALFTPSHEKQFPYAST